VRALFVDGCALVPEAEHCSSCHHEWEEFSVPLEEEPPGRTRISATRCCSVGPILRAWTRTQWAAALRRWRSERRIREAT
jgi:hypothetical protein